MMLGNHPHSQRSFIFFFSVQTPGPGPAESELGLPAPWDSGWRWSGLVGLASAEGHKEFGTSRGWSL